MSLTSILIPAATTVLGSLAVLLFQKRKNRADVRKTEAETSKIEADTSAAIIQMWRDVAKELRTQIAELNEEVQILKQQIHTLSIENAAYIKQLQENGIAGIIITEAGKSKKDVQSERPVQ